MKKLKQILTRLFNYESIDGGGVCPPYLHRWTIFKRKWMTIYLHQFIGPDWTLDPHDHPKRFISIGIWGFYTEYVYHSNGQFKDYFTYAAPWIRTFPPHHLHRITQAKNCWTLVITLKPVREWGFVVNGKWIPWKDYVFGEGETRKNC